MARPKIVKARTCTECGSSIEYTLQVGKEQFIQCKKCKTLSQDINKDRDYNAELIDDVLVVTFKEIGGTH